MTRATLNFADFSKYEDSRDDLTSAVKEIF